MIVADSSVLIALAKMRRLRLLGDLYGEVLVGPLVKAEVVDRGKAIAAPGVDQIELALHEGAILLVRLTSKERAFMQTLLKSSRVDSGEGESIALARFRKVRLIVDDKEARAVATAMRIEHVGTAGVLLDAYRRGHLRLGELEEAVRDLSTVLWLSPAVVIEILKRAREMKK